MKTLISVPEFTYAVVDYQRNTDGVVALNVSTCHLLELCNIGDEGSKTVAGYIHLTVQQLAFDTAIFASLQLLLDSFVAQGGDVSKAHCRLFGGEKFRKERYAARIERLLSILMRLGIYDSQLSLVDGMWMDRNNQAIDLLFSAQGQSFLKMVDPDDEQQDIFADEITTSIQRRAFSNLLQVVNSAELQRTTTLRMQAIAQQRHLLVDNIHSNALLHASAVDAMGRDCYTFTTIDPENILGINNAGYTQFVVPAPL